MSGDFLIWQLHSRAGGEVGEIQRGGGVKKNKNIFTGTVGPYRVMCTLKWGELILIQSKDWVNFDPVQGLDQYTSRLDQYTSSGIQWHAYEQNKAILLDNLFMN